MWKIPQPYHDSLGVLHDVCFWCGKENCRRSHQLAIDHYRVAFKNKWRAIAKQAFGFNRKRKILDGNEINILLGLANRGRKPVKDIHITEKDLEKIRQYKPRGYPETREEKILKKFGY